MGYDDEQCEAFYQKDRALPGAVAAAAAAAVGVVAP